MLLFQQQLQQREEEEETICVEKEDCRGMPGKKSISY
jgi:hypothetical protein